ncbi:hypothetical protein BC834DRAFT_965492 [Gloeopeniophorella convolvens]|nr:hypothetical protein BC834DRAFT_965492 [Gloeopeniophorella convolvens]
MTLSARWFRRFRRHRRARGAVLLHPSRVSGASKAPRLDYRAISENAIYKSHNAFNRKAPLPVGAIQSIDRLYRQQKELSHLLNSKRHAQSTVGARIRQTDNDSAARQAALDEAKQLKAAIATTERDLAAVDDELLELALAVPNDTHPATPLGPESAAALLSTHGPAPLPASKHRDHVAVCAALGLLDLDAGATTALVAYGQAVALRRGFTPVTTPDVVRADVARRCGFAPRDAAAVAQMYHIAGDGPSAHPELVLAGTAEIPLAGMFAGRVLQGESLPRKSSDWARVPRRGGCARGGHARAVPRAPVHEARAVCGRAAAQSERVMEEMREVQVEIFSGLGFPFRVLDMPSEELGASAYRKYDIEAWMPGRGSWGEISSTSNCTDYQARRLHIRHRALPTSPHEAEAKHLPFAHTLNGTAVAVPRLIVALLENGARFNASEQVEGLDLPVALKPFWPEGYAREAVRFSGKEVVHWV